MHPFTLIQYGHAVTETRSSRRRARRAAIAVVLGLLAGPGTLAFADPPQYRIAHPSPTPSAEHGHLPGSHANAWPHYAKLRHSCLGRGT